MDNYVRFSDKWYCRIHHRSFLDRCPLCDPHTPFFLVENAKDKKDASQNLTSDSQVITSNSQGVKVSRDYVKRVKDSIFERFHSYGIKFKATVEWDNIFVDSIKLNNGVEYKRLDFPSAIVKVFKHSILITLRSSSEVQGLSVKDAEAVSIRLIADVLHMLPKSIVVSDSELVSVHNAFVNHPTARYGVSVSVDGEKRLISDNSKGRLEFEAVNPVHAISDSEKLELMNKDLITSVWDLPSVTKFKIDSIIQVQADYAENIKKHLLVQDETLKTLKLLQDSFSRVEVSPNNSFPPPLDSKQSRLLKARSLLKEAGW